MTRDEFELSLLNLENDNKISNQQSKKLLIQFKTIRRQIEEEKKRIAEAERVEKE